MPSCPATLNQVYRGWTVVPGQGAARGYQAGDRADQPVRISSQGSVRLLQPATGGAQFVALQVHQGEGYRCQGAPWRAWDSPGRPIAVVASSAAWLSRWRAPRSGRGARYRPPAHSCFPGRQPPHWRRPRPLVPDRRTRIRQHRDQTVPAPEPPDGSPRRLGGSCLNRGLRVGGSRPGRIKIPAPGEPPRDRASRRPAGRGFRDRWKPAEARPRRGEQSACFCVTAVTER